MAVDVGTLQAQLKLNNSQFIGGLGRSSAAVSTFTAKMTKMSQGMTTAGRRMTMGITLPLVALGVSSVKAAVDSEQRWTQVRKVYDGAASDINRKLVPAVSNLSQKFGEAKPAIVDVTADLAAMGYKGTALMEMLTRSVEFATLGSLDLKDATAGVVATSKIFNVTGKKLASTLSMLNTVENMSAASMGDLLIGIAEAGPVAKVAGVSIEELAAMMAVLRERAIPAGEAGMALKSILTRLQSAGGEAADILDKFNINIRDTEGGIMEADQALLAIAGSWKAMTQAEREDIATGIAGIHQKGRFLSLLDDLSSENSTYRTVLGGVTDETKNLTDAERELNTQLKTKDRQLKRVREKLRNVQEEIGSNLLPVVADLADEVGEAAEAFGKLPKETQQTAIKFAGLAAISGPLLWTLGQIGTSLLWIGKHARGLGALTIGIAGIEGTRRGTAEIADHLESVLKKMGMLGPEAELHGNRMRDAWKVGLDPLSRIELTIDSIIDAWEFWVPTPKTPQVNPTPGHTAIDAVENNWEHWLPGVKIPGVNGVPANATIDETTTRWDGWPPLTKPTPVDTSPALSKISGLLSFWNSLVFPSKYVTVIEKVQTSSGGFSHERQHGGLVDKPEVALIGEAGPELVLPANITRWLMGAVGGRGTTNNFTLNVTTPQEKVSPIQEFGLMQALARGRG